MKKWIYSDSLTLSDIINRIDYFVIVDDCNECNLSVINASDDIDTDDSEYLLSLPDNLLTELSDEEIQSIKDVGVIDRLVKLCKSRLSAKQISLYQKECKKKVPLDLDAKLELLGLFKECDRVVIERRKKNLDFMARYDLSKQDILNILHSLKVEDFDSKTKSVNYSHLGNDLVILHPDILIPDEEILVGANLYVKLDVDESTNSAAAFISIHPRQY